MTIPKENEWEFILYKDVKNWDVPETIEADKIIAQTTVIPKNVKEYVENFSINIEKFNNYKFDLSISWEKTKVIIPIKLSTKEMMENVLNKQLSGPNHDDYYAAARYEVESGKNYERGLEWINKAMEFKEKVSWWDYRLKAYLLIGLNKKMEAKDTAEKGMK